MEIPGIGKVTKEPEFDWYVSEPIVVPVLGEQLCQFLVSGYDDDPNRQESHTAIQNFLSIDGSVLREAERHIFQYYTDIKTWLEEDQGPDIASPADVWDHVRLGSSAEVRRRRYRDRGIYISLECECEWEVEHGLQIVFKNGVKVNKIGPYNGHLTNSDACADSRLEDVVYVSPMGGS
jgi:Domain of unknown function (DUF6985)